MPDGIIQMNNIIELHDVSFRYQKGKNILNHIDISISQGNFLGITGNNGSGKTTFAYLLNGLIPHLVTGTLEGTVFIDGISTKEKEVGFFAKTVGLVFQNPDYSLFNVSVQEEILFGIKNFKLSDQSERVIQSLKMVGMEKYLNHDPKKLSFGQKQKISLACILALNTPVIVLDEPTAMLDFKSSLELYTTLEMLHKKGKTIIVIEHDTDFLLQFTKQTIILNEGSIVSQGSTKQSFKDKKLLSTLGIKNPHLLY